MSWRILNSGFIEVDLTDEMRFQGNLRNQEYFNKYGNSGTHRVDKERQRMTGYFAEMAVKLIYDKLTWSEDPAVDFVFGNKTFDVKSQGCNGVPLDYYVGTLYEEQVSKNLDCYIFCRTKNDFSKVWITGFAPKKYFLQNAELKKSGEKNNNFVYENSRYEIKYKNLKKPQSYLEVLSNLLANK